MITALARFFRLDRLARDRRGVSAVEFALLAPVLIALYMGAAQISLALSADRKVSGAALIVADLAAQRDTITNAQIADYFAAGRAMTAPFDGSGMALRISSVRMDENGQVFLDWSVADGMAPASNTPSLPADLLSPGSSVIIVDAQMPFTTAFGDLFGSPVTLSETAWLRPRRSGHVTNTSEPQGGVDAPPTELLPDPEPELEPEPQPDPEPEPAPPPPDAGPDPDPDPGSCPPGHRRQGRC